MYNVYGTGVDKINSCYTVTANNNLSVSLIDLQFSSIWLQEKFDQQ